MQLKIFLLLPAFSFWLMSSLYHLKFSLFLVHPIETTVGVIKLKDYAAQAGYVLIFLLCIYLMRIFFSPRHRAVFYLWIIWLTGITLINIYLLATPLENIHFIQYAILSILFLWAFSKFQDSKTGLIAKTLFWTTLAGIIDELMQYLWITVSYSQHIDFNDFLLNLMGAVAGILCTICFKPLTRSKFSFERIKSLFTSAEIYLTSLLLFFFTAFYYFDYIQLSTQQDVAKGGFSQYNQHIALFFERTPNLLGNWNDAFNGGEYYILAPVEGTLLILLTAIVFNVLIAKTLHATSLQQYK